jgi:hypothetical protein
VVEADGHEIRIVGEENLIRGTHVRKQDRRERQEGCKERG